MYNSTIIFCRNKFLYLQNCTLVMYVRISCLYIVWIQIARLLESTVRYLTYVHLSLHSLFHIITSNLTYSTTSSTVTSLRKKTPPSSIDKILFSQKNRTLQLYRTSTVRQSTVPTVIKIFKPILPVVKFYLIATQIHTYVLHYTLLQPRL